MQNIFLYINKGLKNRTFLFYNPVSYTTTINYNRQEGRNRETERQNCLKRERERERET